MLHWCTPSYIGGSVAYWVEWSAATVRFGFESHLPVRQKVVSGLVEELYCSCWCFVVVECRYFKKKKNIPLVTWHGCSAVVTDRLLPPSRHLGKWLKAESQSDGDVKWQSRGQYGTVHACLVTFWALFEKRKWAFVSAHPCTHQQVPQVSQVKLASWTGYNKNVSSHIIYDWRMLYLSLNCHVQ